jgi:hypothetical protein
VIVNPELLQRISQKSVLGIQTFFLSWFGVMCWQFVFGLVLDFDSLHMVGKVSLCVNTVMGILSRVTNVFADSRKPPC